MYLNPMCVIQWHSKCNSATHGVYSITLIINMVLPQGGDICPKLSETSVLMQSIPSIRSYKKTMFRMMMNRAHPTCPINSTRVHTCVQSLVRAGPSWGRNSWRGGSRRRMVTGSPDMALEGGE